MVSVEVDLGSKTREALRILRERKSVLVALSGGVDSGVLLALAIEALGRDRVLAVTGTSPSLAASDLDDARAVARAVGAPHVVVETQELLRSGYKANAGDRCYHCRSELFEILRRVATQRGMDAIAYGAIPEDASDDRPGMRAAEEAGILAPLVDAAFTKEEIRALASTAGLPVRDKPASACLASRIPPGVEVTPERLRQIEQAESALRALGFGQLRVRHHGEIARVELDPEGQDRLGDGALRSRVVEAIRAAGFRYVTIDLEGYRTGSLNPTSLYRILPARESGQ
jgi:pyridinium-3,5-biscarboxylic acid mononucleotide sulfurtransferase